MQPDKRAPRIDVGAPFFTSCLELLRRGANPAVKAKKIIRPKKQSPFFESFKNYLVFDNFRKELDSFLFDCILTFLRRLLNLGQVERMRLEQ